MAQPQRSKSTRRGTKQPSARARTKSTTQKTARSRTKPLDNAAEARAAAAAGTRAAGKAVAAAARRAKVPLVIGGAATAGLAGGLAVKARAGRSSRHLDLEAVESAAKRLSLLTGQIGEIAGAIQRGATKP